MLIYIVRRLIVMIPVTILISVIGFIIIQAPPGDFVSSYIAGLEAQGDIIEPELIDSLRARYGLGEPIYVQYWKWVSSFVEGDLGYSMIYREPVVDIIAQRLPSSFTISLLSLDSGLCHWHPHWRAFRHETVFAGRLLVYRGGLPGRGYAQLSAGAGRSVAALQVDGNRSNRFVFARKCRTRRSDWRSFWTCSVISGCRR